jgi:hypothetical protein
MRSQVEEDTEETPPSRRWAFIAVAGAAVAVGALVLVRRRRRSNKARGDLGTSLVDVFASAGDALSSYQDAVADESYLGSSRSRRIYRVRTDDGTSTVAFGDGAIDTSCRH